MSCKTGNGISELKEFILNLALQRKKNLPKSYMILGNLADRDTREFIEEKDLRDLAEKTSNKLADKATFDSAIGTLHNLGYLLYYPQLVERYVILKPQWIVDVFKSVVTINSNKSNMIKDGWLNHNHTRI